MDDTICAISSTAVSKGAVSKSIIRMSGPDTFGVLDEIFISEKPISARGLYAGRIVIDGQISVSTNVYCFRSPTSYTGQDLVEIHIFSAGPIVDAVLGKLLSAVRLAEPGEFTMRAYLNGKLGLAQAEAVAEIISSSNRAQLEAAEKLFAGKLCETAGRIRGELLEVISLIEAGMDFSGEDIEFITSRQASRAANGIKEQLEQILDGSIRYEEMIDMASVGLAGGPNAGKSSLLNALLGKDRSIISHQEGTTRDVLTGTLRLKNCDCTLFDCAGLNKSGGGVDLLCKLSQQAAVESLSNADVVIFCVDITKNDFAEDLALACDVDINEFVLAATKCDRLSDGDIKQKRAELDAAFGISSIVTSADRKDGLDELRSAVNEIILRQREHSTESAERIAITRRHRQIVENAIGAASDAAGAIDNGNDEIAAMLLRAAYQELAGIESEDIDEAILDRIFSQFCIGK